MTWLLRIKMIFSRFPYGWRGHVLNMTGTDVELMYRFSVESLKGRGLSSSYLDSLSNQDIDQEIGNLMILDYVDEFNNWGVIE